MSIHTKMIAIFLVSFVFLFYLILNKNASSPIKNWPVVGMFPWLIHNKDDLHEALTQVLEQGKHTFEFKGPWFSSLNTLLTSDWRNTNYILSKNFNNFKKGPDFNEIFESLGDGIFNSNGQMWKIQHKQHYFLLKHKGYGLAVQRVLREKIEKGLIPILDEFSKRGSVLDLQNVLNRFMFDSFCFLVLGFDPNCLSLEYPDVPYEKAYDGIEEIVFRRHVVPMSLWKLEKWLRIGEEKKMKRVRESFDKFLLDKIHLIRERYSNGGGKEEEFDLLTALLEQYGEKSDRFLRDTAFNLLAAGRDTISASLVWFLWLVATHPSVEENILKEIKEKLNSEEKMLKIYSGEELSELAYLHGAVCEALRLYPPVPFIYRTTIKPDLLPSGRSVGENERILFCAYTMGRSSEIWGEDCLEFKPERWISEKGGILHVPSSKFIPFLTGPRTCLGRDTAFYQIKNIAIAIIQNYHVMILENHSVAPARSILLKMKHGLQVRLSKRHD